MFKDIIPFKLNYVYPARKAASRDIATPIIYEGFRPAGFESDSEKRRQYAEKLDGVINSYANSRMG